jgi:hypothetical protein
MPANVTNFLVTRIVYDYNSGRDACFPIDYWRWNQTSYCVPPPASNGTFSIPLASFTNGTALIPAMSTASEPDAQALDFHLGV